MYKTETKTTTDRNTDNDRRIARLGEINCETAGEKKAAKLQRRGGRTTTQTGRRTKGAKQAAQKTGDATSATKTVH